MGGLESRKLVDRIGLPPDRQGSQAAETIRHGRTRRRKSSSEGIVGIESELESPRTTVRGIRSILLRPAEALKVFLHRVPRVAGQPLSVHGLGRFLDSFLDLLTHFES